MEDVQRLNIYSGKHRVMDKFFAGVKKDLKKSHPDVNVLVAYGSAFNGMKCTGHGEVAAPVSATYKSCKRILNTVVENEDFTTKMVWESGKESRKVYKTFEEKTTKYGKINIKEKFHNCDAKHQSPALDYTNANYEMVKNYMNRKKKPPDRVFGPEKMPKPLHYPEIRGLRFCQESRTYVDRDRKSSLAIARLAVMRMTTFTRPQTFSRAAAN